MVKCPNCDTMNPIDRRYCDECGQDLRSAVAAALANKAKLDGDGDIVILVSGRNVDEKQFADWITLAG